MSMDRLSVLWEKYLADDLSLTELQEFQALGADPAYEGKLGQLLSNVLQDNRFASNNSSDKEAIFHEILAKAETLRQPPRPISRVRHIVRWSLAAAAVLLAMCGYFWFANHKNSTRMLGSALSTDIVPGKEGAVLTLANGAQVLLDSANNGVIASQRGATAKLVNGTLVYDATDTGWVFNSVNTAKGRQFHLMLPDGSKVWLNSLSSIRYPTSFTGSERNVLLTGEAYFEIAPSPRMPFKVNVNGKASVEVLGTDFNINAYENELTINTTLLDGKVKVVAGHAVLLQPHEQAQLTTMSSGSAIKIVSNADIDKVMAWKNGVFDFEDVSLKQAMKQLERWYDIEVVYEGTVPDIYFTGKISKDINLKGVLNLLEDAKVHFRLEQGRRLIVTE